MQPNDHVSTKQARTDSVASQTPINEQIKQSGTPLVLPADPVFGNFGTPVKKRPKTLLIALGILMLTILTGAVIFVYQKTTGTSDTDDNAKNNSAFPVTSVVTNDYTIYKKTIVEDTYDPTDIYTLVDRDGNKVAETTRKGFTSLLSPLSDKSFLLKGSVAGSSNVFFIMNEEGLSQLTGLPSSAQTKSVDGQTNQTGLTVLSNNIIGFQYCKLPNEINIDDERYQCDYRTIDLVKKSEEIFKLPSKVIEYRADLIEYSPDKKFAYYLGTSPAESKKASKMFSEVTGGGVQFENDLDPAKLTNFKYKKSVLKVELSTGKVLKESNFDVGYTYYNNYLLSPDGENIIYSSGGESGVIQFINTANNSQESITLTNKDYSTEPFGGRTTTYDPLYSINGDLLAFVTYGPTVSTEHMGVLNLKTKEVKILMSTPDGTTSTFESFFDNMIWRDETTLHLVAGKDNIEIDTRSGTTKKIDSQYGELVGIADGFR